MLLKTSTGSIVQLAQSGNTIGQLPFEFDEAIQSSDGNRRIGEFLKELELTEGRATGIPMIWDAMKQNDSPAPVFETDAGRTYFLVRLPIHPQMREAHDQAHDLNDIERRIRFALQCAPKSFTEIAEQFGYSGHSGAMKSAIKHLDALGFIALTIPEKPKSKRQKRVLTQKGKRVVMLLNP